MSAAFDLREIARALGGEVTGRQVLAPGPNHSRRDRSLSVRISNDAPGGFIVASFADDDFTVCRDYVADRLGLPSDYWRTQGQGQGQGPSRPAPMFTPREPGPEQDHAARIARAVAIWHEAVPAQGTVVARYLASRGLDLPEGAEVLRHHPRCPWRDEAENRTIFVPAMVAAMRAIVETVRTEFLASYAAESHDAKKKQWVRVLKEAIERELVATRDLGTEGQQDWVWLTAKGAGLDQ